MTAQAFRKFSQLLILTIAFMLALHSIATAQQRQSSSRNSAATMDKGAQAQVTAAPEIKTLAGQSVTATVTVLRTQKAYPVGGSAFARIELKNTGKSRFAAAELNLQAETAEIVGVTGKKIDVSGDQKSRTLKAAKISKGKSSVLFVELALRETDSSSRNALNITLQSPQGPSESIRFEWDAVDCADGFYSEITKVRDGSGSGIEQALKAARKRDKSRPGRWLFSPRTASASRRGKCLKSVRRWNKRRGRHVYICTKFEAIASSSSPSSVPYEGRVYRFASRLVSARAIDRELAPTRDSGWATTRVAQNLQGFLNQKKNPALCTGPLKAFEYYDARLAGFLKRAETYDDMAAKSYALALLRTVEAIDASNADPGGHPGWGAAPLFAASGNSEISLRQMIETIAKIPDGASIGEAVSAAPSVLDGLKALSQFMKSEVAKSIPKDTGQAMQRALGAIEAADYVTTVAGQYADLRHALAGSMTTLREAHASHCTCNG